MKPLTIEQHQAKILRALENGEAYWGVSTPTSGSRQRSAADRLKAVGKLRIVPFEDRKTYVCIPPDCEWDNKNHCIRRPAPFSDDQVPIGFAEWWASEDVDKELVALGERGRSAAEVIWKTAQAALLHHQTEKQENRTTVEH